MAFCSNCGMQLPAGALFCPACGKPQSPGAATAPPPAYADPDVMQNKWMAALCYIGPLVFIPMFAKKDSPFTQYHAKQGLLLFALEVIFSVLRSVCGLFALTMLNPALPRVFLTLPFWLVLAFWALRIGILVLCVLGIVHVCNGQRKELPLIGSITVFDSFFK